MKLKNDGKFVCAALMIIGILIMLSSAFFVEPIDNKKIDCYDRHHNKIIGLECESHGTELTSESIGLILIGFLVYLFSLIIHTYKNDDDDTNFFGFETKFTEEYY